MSSKTGPGGPKKPDEKSTDKTGDKKEGGRYHMSRDARKPVSGFPTRFNLNRPVQSQKMVRGWKFRI